MIHPNKVNKTRSRDFYYPSYDVFFRSKLSSTSHTWNQACKRIFVTLLFIVTVKVIASCLFERILLSSELQQQLLPYLLEPTPYCSLPPLVLSFFSCFTVRYLLIAPIKKAPRTPQDRTLFCLPALHSTFLLLLRGRSCCAEYPAPFRHNTRSDQDSITPSKQYIDHDHATKCAGGVEPLSFLAILPCVSGRGLIIIFFFQVSPTVIPATTDQIAQCDHSPSSNQ